MKKAKIILMAIAVIGVVSGALAIKAKKSNSIAYYLDPVANTCTIPYTGGFLCPGMPGNGTYGYITFDPSLKCTYTFYTVCL